VVSINYKNRLGVPGNRLKINACQETPKEPSTIYFCYKHATPPESGTESGHNSRGYKP